MQTSTNGYFKEKKRKREKEKEKKRKREKEKKRKREKEKKRHIREGMNLKITNVLNKFALNIIIKQKFGKDMELATKKLKCKINLQIMNENKTIVSSH